MAKIGVDGGAGSEFHIRNHFVDLGVWFVRFVALNLSRLNAD